MVKRIFLFYDVRGRLVREVPWEDVEPPYLVEAAVRERGDGESEETPDEMRETIH